MSVKPPPGLKVEDVPVGDFVARWMDQIADLVGRERFSAGKPPGTVAMRRIVLIGDSLFERWTGVETLAAAGTVILNRGISGQTTSQMLLRLRRHGLSAHPAVVVIGGGTNDVRAYVGDAEVCGPRLAARALEHLEDMATLSEAEGAVPIVAGVPPIRDTATVAQTRLRNPDVLADLDRAVRALCERRGWVFWDRRLPLSDIHGELAANLTDDGLHPNDQGFERLAPSLATALAAALGRSALD